MRPLPFLVAVAMLSTSIPVSAQSSRVAIVSPGPGGSISGKQAEVSISYNTDTANKVTDIQITIDGKKYGTKHLSEPRVRGVVSFIVDTSALGSNSHTIIAKVYSGDKLIGSASNSCKIGNRPLDVISPQLQFDGIKNGDVVSGITAVELAAKDSGGPAPMVSVLVDKKLKMLKNSEPYSYDWDTRECDNGRHVLEAYAYDESGNKTEAQSVEVVVRNPEKGIKSNELASIAPTKKMASDAIAVRTTTTTLDSTPVVPIERTHNATAARSVEKSVATTTPSTAKSTQTEKALVVAQVPTELAPAATSEPKTPEVTVSDKKLAEPSSTAPRLDVNDSQSTALVASGSQSYSEPSEPAMTSAAEPVRTVETVKPSIETPDVKSVNINKISSQRLARPEMPVNKPIVLAKAPTTDVPTLPTKTQVKPRPVAVPEKEIVILQTSKRKGATITELRYAIERAGGVIISWDPKTHEIVAMLNGKRLQMSLDEAIALVGGNSMSLGCAPFVNAQGRTMVDVKFLKKLLGTRLVMDKNSQKMKLVLNK